ncbi:hypothetical protein C8Q76DRAFT_789536 [Earliella scabrosa]|nr:hypothetical protein C8Q76DRAFT_789536 [Earliella scabrosa]
MLSFSLYGRDYYASDDLSILVIAIGSSVSQICFGQAAQEAYHHFRRYPKDGWDLKAIIVALIAFDTLHTVLVTLTSYSVFVRLPASSGYLDELPLILFELRAFWLLPPAAAATMIMSHLFEKGVSGTTDVVIALAAMSLYADIALTTRLVTFLRKSRSGFKSTDTLIKKLSLFAINTGLLTGLFTIMPLVLLAAVPTSPAVCFPVAVLLAPVHTSAVLAAVNSRRSLVDRGSEGLELRTFDLDIAPTQEPATTIRLAANRSPSAVEDSPPNVSVGAAPELHVVLDSRAPSATDEVGNSQSP